ncbi:MAG: GyrI-like domain-containing protein [Candidatus Aenigmatarchaeota archaeon]
MAEVEIVSVEPILVLGVRQRGPYSSIAELIPMLCEFAMNRGIDITGPPIFICHETAEQTLEADKNGTADVEVAIPIASRTDDEDEFKCYELPGGEMAKTVHKGRYQDCGPAYERLFAWIAQNGRQVSGPTREVYVNGPSQVPEEEITTEIYAPVD